MTGQSPAARLTGATGAIIVGADSDPRTSTGATEWRRGWPVVLTALVGSGTVAAQTLSLGLLMKPLDEAFGWSRGAVALSLSFSAVASIILGPFMGGLVDRHGVRTIALLGAPLSALGLILIGLSGPTLISWYAAWTFYAIVQVANGPMVWSSAITHMFTISRGKALGLALSGAGFGGLIYPGLMLWLFGDFGWRGVYIGVAALNFALLTPLVCFALPRRRRVTATAVRNTSPVARQVAGMLASEAVRTSLFWRIGSIVAATGVAIASMAVHLQPLLTDSGMSTAMAASIVAMIGPSVIVGRLVGGILLDRIHARWIAVAFLVLPAAGSLMLVNFDGSYARAAFAAVAVGLASGAEGDLLAIMVARYFGLRRFGTIYGLSMSLFAMGYALAPMGAGRLYDAVGSYSPGLIGLSAALFAAVIVAFTLGPYPLEHEIGSQVREPTRQTRG